MSKLKIIELFAGIGAPSMALKKNNIDFEIVGFSEIDNLTIQAYHTLHGKDIPNFGDITKITELPACDFLHASSPCQSFCHSGKREGLNGESGLIREFYRLMENYYERKELPTYISFENVPELKEEYPQAFQELMNNLNRWGYDTYDMTLEAYKFGNPTRRRRLFVIGILKNKNQNLFKEPISEGDTISMNQFLFEEAPDKYYRSDNPPFVKSGNEKNRKEGDRIGYLRIGVNKATQSNGVFNRNSLCPSITRTSYFYIQDEKGFRKIMPKELWLIMGYSEENYEKIKDFSDSKIKSMVGNSIALGPLSAIYKELKKEIDKEFD